MKNGNSKKSKFILLASVNSALNIISLEFSLKII